MTPIPQEIKDNHTPGPWIAKGFTVTKSTGFKIRQERPAGAGDWEQIDKNYEADAQLIAKAPEMLEELEAKDKEIKQLCDSLLDVATKSGQEIERLKGLIEDAHTRGWLDYPEDYDKPISIEDSWNKFKTKNNL